MSQADTQVDCGCSTLFIVLIILKTFGVLNISWWWLIGPMIFFSGLGAVVGVAAVAIYILAKMLNK